jgi:hypothetical protein
MSKKPVPAFLQKGGGGKIARGEEPPGAKSKKLPPFRPGGKEKPLGKGVNAKKA